MRNRSIACIFALFLGGIGVHKFYLGKVGQGVFYAIFSMTFIPVFLGFIDFIRLATMSEDEFNRLYNDYIPFTTPKEWQTKHRYRNAKQDTVVFENRRNEPGRDKDSFSQKERRKKRPMPLTANRAYKDGVKLLEDYRYREALEQFERARKASGDHPEILFRMACCNAVLEQKAELLEHLLRAIKNGFKDFDRIRTTDALAYFRIQKEYEAIEVSGFVDWPAISEDETEAVVETVEKTEVPNVEQSESVPLSTDELLFELKKLGEMRQNGVITEDEFLKRKQKLYA